ncbi:dihydroflavonol-4-reductase/farnesol dehydrogenase [Mucilaginibacter lappiensis]|uniref:Dihydroflavonol-4-reductase/farnesol dehydrogenase n=1 Tax=Mucilaginibacter lappiensis TaxID=354630 RepID=A0ABR6PQ59_9SPHI|nr:NAD-dependent epimerase/dehydratase family protein [Mucilaginibacter lappiensis]MBB6111864.1 dihydroflavonol-4-reductase/farnesol dehydrogenase [Mucilaginibacter lappiensis]SIR88798.1 dihydroflavonol-4-reductase/farnesol dehydrogenase [Mucilaginibacter lappiensis]
MKVLVTGATGFIGRQLTLALANAGHEVKALCRNTDHPYLIKHPNIEPVLGNILYKQSLARAMDSCEQVYHTAAMAKMWCRNTDDYHETNVTGTQNVLEVAKTCKVQKLVYTSTCGVWGPTIKHPMTETDPRITGFPIAYERTKYLAELEVQSFVKQGLPVVIVNPSRVYGEGPITDSNTVGKMVSGYLKGKWRIIPGNGEQVANYAFLDDVVAGHIAAMDKGITGERYILGGHDISFNDFFKTLQQVSGKQLSMIRIPLKAIEIYSRLEWLKTRLTGLSPVFLPEFAERLKYDQKYCSSKAVTHLGYTITPFVEGLQKTVNYLKESKNNVFEIKDRRNEDNESLLGDHKTNQLCSN